MNMLYFFHVFGAHNAKGTPQRAWLLRLTLILTYFLFNRVAPFVTMGLSYMGQSQVLYTINQSQTDQAAGQVVLVSGLDQEDPGSIPGGDT